MKSEGSAYSAHGQIVMLLAAGSFRSWEFQSFQTGEFRAESVRRAVEHKGLNPAAGVFCLLLLLRYSRVPMTSRRAWCGICGGAVRVWGGSWRDTHPGGLSLGTQWREPGGHGEPPSQGRAGCRALGGSDEMWQLSLAGVCLPQQ